MSARATLTFFMSDERTRSLNGEVSVVVDSWESASMIGAALSDRVKTLVEVNGAQETV